MSAPRPPRLFTVDDVLEGRANLDHYPVRYISLGTFAAAVLGTSGLNKQIDRMLTAVEMLESRGWELVTLEQNGRLAFLRRR
jgi:hypothetical protein